MKGRCLAVLFTVTVVVTLAPVPTAGEGAQGQTAAPDTSTAPRTTWGDPDLQGVWNNNVSTPMERPDEFADRAFLSVEERAAYTARRPRSVSPTEGSILNARAGGRHGGTGVAAAPAASRGETVSAEAIAKNGASHARATLGGAARAVLPGELC